MKVRPRGQGGKFGIFARKAITAGTNILREAPLAILAYPSSEFNQTLAYEILTPENKAHFDNLHEHDCQKPECGTTKVWRIWAGNEAFTLCHLVKVLSGFERLLLVGFAMNWGTISV